MEERNDSAGETDEFRCAVCQMSNYCQEKNPRGQVVHGVYKVPGDIIGGSASLQYVDITPWAISMEDGDEMALSREGMPLTPWGVIKREMIGWNTG